eukprot:543686_1
MIAALTEITAQQNEFFNFLTTMSDGIEKIHEKQHQTEKDIANRFDSMTETIQSIEITPHDAMTSHRHSPTSSLLMFDQGDLSGLTTPNSHSRGVSLMSSVTAASAAGQDERETLNELISSMRSYLDNPSTKQADYVAKKQQESGNAVIKSAGPYSVGNVVDVLDVSYVWYSATILDIDAFDKRAIYVSYDEFDEAWNEWIPMNKKYRISPARSRTNVVDMNPLLRTQHGGVHCLCATKYGRNPNAQDLQNVFSSQNYDNERLTPKAILIQGHLYKQASWSKKTWKRRWFVIMNNQQIYYYDHKNVKSKQYRGVISLDQIAVIQMSKTKGYTKHSFDIITLRNKKHRFSANNEHDLTDWLSVLECLLYSDCPQIKKDKFTKINNDDEEEEEQEEPPKRPVSPLMRNISGFFSELTGSKPTTPRQTYTATYEMVDAD